MGDFNQPYGTLPQEETLRAHGFVEIQQFGHLKWGRQPKPTCKQVTIKDFIWVSPEMIPLLVDIHMDDTLFPDHSVLAGTFNLCPTFEPIPIWIKPTPIPWSETLLEDYNDEISSDGDTCMHLQRIFFPYGR